MKKIVDAVGTASRHCGFELPGGACQFFEYIVDLLKEKERNRSIRRRRGGVMIHDEINELEKYGVTKTSLRTAGWASGHDQSYDRGYWAFRL